MPRFLATILPPHWPARLQRAFLSKSLPQIPSGEKMGFVQPTWTISVLLVALLIPASAFGQDNDAQNRELQRQVRQEEERKVQESLRALDNLSNQRLRPLPSSSRGGKNASERAKLFATIPLFREATARYREALGLEPDVRTHAKGIEKLISPLDDYFDTMKFKRPAVDLSEYAEISPADLAWETLTMAERVDNNLQIVRQLVQQSEREGVIDIKTLEFFGQIQDDLSRLKWLASRASEKPPSDKR